MEEEEIANLSFSYYPDFNDTEYVPYQNRIETYIVPLVFSLVFVVGLLGNGTLVYIFLRNKAMRSIPNIYIISLAVGDFVVIVGTLPFTSTIYIFESWPYGDFLCKLSEFFKDVSQGVTVLTLTMLSIDRYIAIVMPIKKHTGRHAKSMTVLLAWSIWCISIALAAPGAYYSRAMKFDVTDDKDIYVCYPFPKEMFPWYPRTIVLVKFVLLYGAPLVCITTFYALMARHLMLSSRSTIGENPTHKRQMKTRIKVAKIVLAFVLIFFVCFFPTQVFMMWFYYHPQAQENYNDFWHILKISGYVLAFVNSCLNPIALYLVSGVFRSYFKKYLFCCCQSKTEKSSCYSSNSRLTMKTIHSTVRSNYTFSGDQNGTNI